jgi:hypothetical protein
MLARYVAILSTLWAATGCSETLVSTTPLNPPPFTMTPKAPADVELYSSSPPKRPHIDVALLEAVQDDSGEDHDEMLAKLRESAAQMGCDAVFVGGLSYRSGDPNLGQLFDPNKHVLRATCMVYVPADVPPNSSIVTSGDPAAPSEEWCRRHARDLGVMPRGTCRRFAGAGP